MAYNLKDKLVITVASSALFDLNESDHIYRTKSMEEYSEYQREHEDDVLERGVAFPLIKRLLNLNHSFDEPVIEVILLSRNNPDTGLRVFKSIEHYKLAISRAMFTGGRDPFVFMEALNATLFLSKNMEDVKAAIEHGLPAGCVYSSSYEDLDEDDELRLAFDFDGIIADDSSENIYQDTNDIKEYLQHEKSLADEKMGDGPLYSFISKLSRIQEKETELVKRNPAYVPKLRIAVCTARNAPAHERAIKTLRKGNIRVDEAFFLGGINKNTILSVYKPHIFFDDQSGHIEKVAHDFPSVHVPYGKINKKK